MPSYPHEPGRHDGVPPHIPADHIVLRAGTYDPWSTVNRSVIRRRSRFPCCPHRIVGLVAGTVVYASARKKSVVVSIDGKEQVVQPPPTPSATCSTTRHRARRARRRRPGRDRIVDDGSRIAVSYGRQLTLNVDGEKQTYWTTATNVDDALASARAAHRARQRAVRQPVGARSAATAWCWRSAPPRRSSSRSAPTRRTRSPPPG